MLKGTFEELLQNRNLNCETLHFALLQSFFEIYPRSTDCSFITDVIFISVIFFCAMKHLIEINWLICVIHSGLVKDAREMLSKVFFISFP